METVTVDLSDAPASEPKMWLAVRTDLGISPQKLAGQSGHAFGNLFLDVAVLAPDLLRDYTRGREPGSDVSTGQAKIVVVAKNEAALLRVREEARLAGIPSMIVRDEGRSEVEPGTATVVAFGPARREDLPSYLRRLRRMEDRDSVSWMEAALERIRAEDGVAEPHGPGDDGRDGPS